MLRSIVGHTPFVPWLVKMRNELICFVIEPEWDHHPSTPPDGTLGYHCVGAVHAVSADEASEPGIPAPVPTPAWKVVAVSIIANNCTNLRWVLKLLLVEKQSRVHP